MKELTESQVNSIKEKLIKFKNELVRRNKINNRIKKDLNNFKSIKDIRYLFNEYEDEYEDIRYLFNENDDVDEGKESPLILEISFQKMEINYSKHVFIMLKK